MGEGFFVVCFACPDADVTGLNPDLCFIDAS